jgi:WS/DGAT/MGAT family acyltransferase
MVIVGITVTETPVRPAEFRRLVKDRFLCFPRFRQRPVSDALGASWVEDEGFDLDTHVKLVALTGPGGRTELEALAGHLASTPLDASRPLWQIHLVKHYAGGSAWISRIHHCYADGIAMIRVLLSMTEDRAAPGDAGPSGRRTDRPGRRRRIDLLPLIDWVGQISPPAGDVLEAAVSGGARLLETGLHQTLHPEQAVALARHAGGMVGELAKVIALPDDPATPLRGALSGRKAIAWADPFPLEEIRTVGRALDCTINDVLMSTVAGALGEYLRDQGHDVQGLRIRATVPVNLRGPEQALSLGNRFGLMFVEMPLGMRNPLRRLYAMHATMAGLKGSMQPPMTLAMLGLLGMLPAAVQAPAIELFSRKGTAVVSNVPGPATPRYVCGQRISEMFFWVPQSGSMGVGVSVLTYAGRVHVGMIGDRNLVPDPRQVVGRFAPEFERLRSSISVAARAAGHKKKTAMKTHKKTRKATKESRPAKSVRPKRPRKPKPAVGD